ncbi:MAG TPA: DUF4405 domain-containing protein [Candidatus Aminicenantes bacterium]|nr:DUF4405 domain-containing protein [Candidatus Aminicenantes bacterium]
MSRTDWKYLIDSLMFVCIVGIVIIGFLMGLVIPEGPAATESSKYFLGLHRHQWGNIHFYLSIVFVSLVIVHLILSWSWIKGKARQLFKKAWKIGLLMTAITSILVLTIFWLLYPRLPGVYEGYGLGRGREVVETQRGNYSIPKREGIDKVTVFDEEKKSDISEAKEESSRLRKSDDLLPGSQRQEQKEAELEALGIQGWMTFLDIERRTGIPASRIVERLGLPRNVPLHETLGRLRRQYLFSMQEVREVVLKLIKESKR